MPLTVSQGRRQQFEISVLYNFVPKKNKIGPNLTRHLYFCVEVYQ